MKNLIQRIAKGAKKGLIIGSLAYVLATLGAFMGASAAVRETDAEYNLNKEQRIFLNQKNLNKYDSYSLPKKALMLWEYLAYKLYQENLERGQIEGVQ